MSASEEPEIEAQSAAAEGEAQRPGGQPPHGVHEVPLFLRGGSEGQKGNAQDEKDEMAE
jgi:hypothetical protein